MIDLVITKAHKHSPVFIFPDFSELPDTLEHLILRKISDLIYYSLPNRWETDSLVKLNLLC